MASALRSSLAPVAVLSLSTLGACGYRTAPMGIEVRDAQTKQPVCGATVSLVSYYMMDIRGGHPTDKVWTTDERGVAILDTAELTRSINATITTTDGVYTRWFAHTQLAGCSGWLDLDPQSLPSLRPIELQTLDLPAADGFCSSYGPMR